MPAAFDAELGKYTREGLRVLGLATRQLAGLSEGEVQGMAQVRGGDMKRSRAGADRTDSCKLEPLSAADACVPACMLVCIQWRWMLNPIGLAWFHCAGGA